MVDDSAKRRHLSSHRDGPTLTVPLVALLASATFLVALPRRAANAQHAAPSRPVIVQPGAPGEPSRTLPSDTTAILPPRAKADVEFMQGMIMHHTQAVTMTSLIPSHTQNPQIRSLGARIGSSQADELNLMQRWLAARGQPTAMNMPGMPEMTMSGKPMPSMPGMLTAAQIEALRNAHGADFDRLFLTGMIQHHRGALTMVGGLFNTPGAGQDADLFDFATDADNTQRAEIGIMQAMLKNQFTNKSEDKQ